MYLCHNCNATFDEPGYRVEREVHDWLDDKPVREMYFEVCPECGSEYIGEAEECCYCQKAYSKEDLIGGVLCINCLDEILRGRQDIVRAYININPEDFAEFVAASFDPREEREQGE